MIYFIRHAESEYNSRVKRIKQKNGEEYKDTNQYFAEKFNQELFDVDLSQYGIQQCLSLVKTFHDVQIELVLVSPLRRALRTCYLLFKDHPSKPKVIVQPLLCQRLSSASSIGSKLEQSMNLFSEFDFSKIADRSAWYVNSLANQQIKQKILQKVEGLNQKQRKVEIQREALGLIKKVDKQKYRQLSVSLFADYNEQKDVLSHHLKKYSKIAVVSHSKCLKRLIGKRVTNSQIVILQFTQLK